MLYSNKEMINFMLKADWIVKISKEKWKAERPEEFCYGCYLSVLTGLAKYSPADLPKRDIIS